MPNLRLIAWNCNHGSLAERVTLLQPLKPDIVFLQECRPGRQLPLHGDFLSFTVNERKGIALGSLTPDYTLTEIGRREGCGRAVIAADVAGPLSFSLLGVWSNAPSSSGYVVDVLRSLEAYADVLRGRPTVVMGDLNSGPKLNGAPEVSDSHARLLSSFAAHDMVSAYHAFYKVEHGNERHHTYRHQPAGAEPWHIDFCFVPSGWTENVVNVQLVDGDEWRATSDHHPLVVDLTPR
jgi:endonuclease/exonuclease/phosphatase family metal-dependent hydrolase